ncbi:aminoglycoside phosphotransferase [Paraburkholderia ginsengiterrae]|uniref:Aminoglycoside phosphotransferase n=1 Tax=Paraburkholderia ginsengiterrae TaxID=1462993 RepID=A0A1A9N7M5_9BURK|nr:phosphotransferase [Paraburkholderia ginsengiterrae]OAJ55111.1 aminoglycoside phosphotransferase [Paraburkholderia ginsengiterrae]OAJ61297.1 aminoglycoside phosphotransferase [Paraburkholderia ginsengiterrae]
MNASLQFDVEQLTRYLTAHVPGFQGPMSIEKFAGGQSNPTFLLTAQSGRYVLRRQPPGTLLKSAHAVDREFRVLTAVSATPVPVARALHLCEDRDVIGSMFYVMSFEEGEIFWDPALPGLPAGERGAIYDALLGTMAALHDVDVEAVGLADYGRAGNYFSRQIDVWTKQYRAAQTDNLDSIEALIEWLPAHCPAETGKPSLVHGDFRIDNIMFRHGTPQVRAVLDWELSTLGNPLADIAYFCMCLRLPPAGHIVGLAGLDRAAMGVPDESAIIAQYCRLRGIASIENWNFYLAFSFFRLAAIAQGVKKRALGGNASNDKARQVGEMAGALAKMGVELI